MLLESFKEQLEIIREFARYHLGVIDPLRLGHDMSTSFSVKVRTALHGELVGQGTYINSTEVNLVQVGKLIRKKENVLFDPDEILRQDCVSSTLRLAGFLNEWLGTSKSNFLGIFTWDTVFRQPDLMSEVPWFPCFDMLEKLGTDILLQLRKKDKMLKRVSLEKCEEAFCLYIHDAIASGHGIEIEWLGCINRDCSFDVDSGFAKDLEILHGEHTIDSSEEFEVSTLRIGPLPKFSKIGPSKEKQ